MLIEPDVLRDFLNAEGSDLTKDEFNEALRLANMYDIDRFEICDIAIEQILLKRKKEG